MKLILTSFSLTFLLTTCTSQIISGVFEIGPDKMDCKIYGECDCCTSSLFFIDDSSFALMDYCTFDYTLSSGTYKVDKGTLTLKFKQASVTSGQDFTVENSEPYMERNEVEIKPIVFSFGQCENGELMLENRQFSGYRFCLRTNTGEQAIIYELLNSEEWKLLNK